MNMAIEVIVKKWGNSMGIILPKELVNRENLKENEKISIELVKKVDFSNIFGALKGKLKISSQQFKNETRREEKLRDDKKWKHLTS